MVSAYIKTGQDFIVQVKHSDKGQARKWCLKQGWEEGTDFHIIDAAALEFLFIAESKVFAFAEQWSEVSREENKYEEQKQVRSRTR